MALNRYTTSWHALDLIVQAKAPFWFRIFYALIGLVGNLAGAGQSVVISRELANSKVDAWLQSHPNTRN